MINEAKVESAVRNIIEPVLDDMSKELVFIEYLREHGRWILRLYVDRKGSSGITVDELAEVSREVGTILDVEDVITGSYNLEVSSPGLDRPLGRIEDCARFAGKMAFVTTREPLEGRRKFKGVLTAIEGGSVLIDVEGYKMCKIPWVTVKRAHLVAEYKFGEKKNAES